ncbi:DUF5719 family protein [Microbacterium sp. LTA6]|uniref:DUF5719 family protein n=1 Tax=Microbacterium sp. LTA6 TaxID=3129771 RepID=UPI003243BD56
MSGTRAFRVVTTSARVLTGTLVAAACVVGVVVAVAAPWPTIESTPAQADVTPLPGDAVLVCSGDFRAIGRVPSDPLKMDSAGTPRLTVDGSAGVPESTPLSMPELDQAGELHKLTGVVEGRSAPLIGAAESVTLAETDLSGLAAAPCREALTESWLIGGSVATGTEDIVTLTNPGDVAATVTLTVFGDKRSSSNVIVPPATQVALPLASIASGNQAPVIHMSSTGSPVRAMMQSSLTRTLDPAGIDLQDAVAGPQQHPVISGVQVFPVDGDDSEMAVLRILAPDADAQAQVTVRPVGESSSVATEFLVPLTADVPAQVSLGDLGAGSYTVEVDADSPVLAAVRQQDGQGRGADFAWVTPAPEIDAEVLVAVPSGPNPQLLITGNADAESTVAIETAEGGDPQTILVPAGGSIAVPVDARSVYTVRPSGPVHLAVTMTATGALAAWPVWPGAGAEQSITVYP